jgi:hypothetical protein
MGQCGAVRAACTPSSINTKSTPACRFHGARHQGHSIVGFCCSLEFVEKCLHVGELIIYVLDIFMDVNVVFTPKGICPYVHILLDAYADACAVRARHMHPMCIQW